MVWVIWGFWGGEHARFADFAAGPLAIVSHVRNLFSKTPARHLGHNPLGGVAVFLLLASVTIIVATALFSGGEENAGPFAGMWGAGALRDPRAAFRVLQALTILHVVGVIVVSFKTKDALVPAMITGSKKRREGEPGSDARRAGLLALLVAAALGAAITGALVMTPSSTNVSVDRGNDRDGDE